jgi:hypothetical protein
MRVPAVFLLMGMLAGNAAAEQLPPAPQKLMWCSSALFWLGMDASDAGQEAEADQYLNWSTDLSNRFVDVMRAEGQSDAAIQGLMDDLDAAAIAELGTPEARFDITECPALAEELR